MDGCTCKSRFTQSRSMHGQQNQSKLSHKTLTMKFGHKYPTHSQTFSFKHLTKWNKNWQKRWTIGKLLNKTQFQNPI